MLKPQFVIKAEEEKADFARFVIEPLPQGYGDTLGNSLRRVLYTSISGSAITSVKINGANHQFTTLEGMQEDVVQLVLALKQVRAAYSGEKPVKITLEATGPGTVTAGQFETPAEVKIANPDLVIANLGSKSTKLEIEATVESGFGYSPADERKSTTLGVIPVDATFTPVIRVNYKVQSTRVGRMTDFDKLIMEVYTTGTVSPRQALTSAADTLVGYFNGIVNPETLDADAPSSAPSARPVAGSNVSIEELDLPTRISNALQKAGFQTVADLLASNKPVLSKVKNLGGKSVDIIEEALKQRSFSLAQWNMRHNVFGKQLNRDTGQRQALLKGLAGALIRSEAIETTEAKAKAVVGLIEKLISKAKSGKLSDVRHIEAVIIDKSLVEKLVNEIAPRFKSRTGGYLRLIKMGNRAGDNAPMVRMELVAATAVKVEAEPASKSTPEKAPTEKKAAKPTKSVAKAKK